MFFTLAACSLILLTQEAAKPAPAPVDRSAEPALKQLFASCGAIRNVHIAVEIYPRETIADRYDDDSSMDLWLADGGRFRIANLSKFWGGGSLVVSDGLSVLADDMSDDSAIRLKLAYKNLHEASAQEPLLYLMEGPSGFEALVAKDKDVKFIPAQGGEKAIELNGKDLGKLVFIYSERDGAPFPSHIEEFKAPWWSDDAGKSSDKPYTREDIRLVAYGPFDSSLFAVTGPKGKKVVDERSKK